MGERNLIADSIKHKICVRKLNIKNKKKKKKKK